MKTKTIKPSINSTKTLSTTTTVVTKYFLNNSDVNIIETSTNGKSVFHIEGKNDCWAVIISSDVKIETLTYSEILDKVKHQFSSIDEIELDRVFYLYTDGHVIFDSSLVPVPTVYRFDYIGTPFHNGVLHLEKALEVLKKHPWVVNKNTIKIQDIPYYNADERSNKFIQVDILPDKKTYARLYKKAKERVDGFWSTRLRELLHDGYCPDRRHNLLGLLGCVKPKREED